MNIYQYEEKVEVQARVRDGSPIYNGSYAHAEVLVRKLFEHARLEVNILSGFLNARVFGTQEVCARARQFLSKPERKIKVLLQDPKGIDKDDHLFFQKFEKHKDVEIRCLSDDIADILSFHFVVMDKDSYRFENDIKAEGAIAAFGDEMGGKNLSEVFEKLWGNGHPLDSSSVH